MAESPGISILTAVMRGMPAIAIETLLVGTVLMTGLDPHAEAHLHVQQAAQRVVLRQLPLIEGTVALLAGLEVSPTML